MVFPYQKDLFCWDHTAVVPNQSSGLPSRGFQQLILLWDLSNCPRVPLDLLVLPRVRLCPRYTCNPFCGSDEALQSSAGKHPTRHLTDEFSKHRPEGLGQCLLSSFSRALRHLLAQDFMPHADCPLSACSVPCS